MLNQLQAINTSASRYASASPPAPANSLSDGSSRCAHARTSRSTNASPVPSCATSQPTRALGHDAKRYEHELALLVRARPRLNAARRARDRTDLRREAPRVRPGRFKTEAAFAQCNGAAPIPASSGKTIRYRLNRGGDRQTNNAIHTIGIICAKHQPETRAFLERRLREGKTKREVVRSLRRHLSRELCHRLTVIPLTS